MLEYDVQQKSERMISFLFPFIFSDIEYSNENL